jgi:hypothetical protein
VRSAPRGATVRPGHVPGAYSRTVKILFSGSVPTGCSRPLSRKRFSGQAQILPLSNCLGPNGYPDHVNTVNGTAQRGRSRRVLVRRRTQPTLDAAWAAVLADLPPVLHPLMIRYVENMQQGQEIRSELSTALTRNGLRWWEIDKLAHSLL